MNLPEDAGYDTLGGFVSNTSGRIPEAGAEFHHDGAKFIVLDAEPQRVKRVKIELTPLPSDDGGPAHARRLPDGKSPARHTPKSREPAAQGTRQRPRGRPARLLFHELAHHLHPEQGTKGTATSARRWGTSQGNE